MSSDIDIEMVRKTYQRMTDEEIVRVLTQEAVGLTPEAIEAVKEEIKKRQLDPNIEKAVDVQNKSISLEELDQYCELVQQLPCPVTGSTVSRLNATTTVEVMSFILFTQYRKALVVASPGILDKANNNALVKSILLGWWGVPWGIIRTFQAIFINVKNKKTNHLDTPNEHLRSFVLSRIGEIETYKNNKEKLLQIISGN
jgi:hypothetical protein